MHRLMKKSCILGHPNVQGAVLFKMFNSITLNRVNIPRRGGGSNRPPPFFLITHFLIPPEIGRKQLICKMNFYKTIDFKEYMFYV